MSIQASIYLCLSMAMDKLFDLTGNGELSFTAKCRHVFAPNAGQTQIISPQANFLEAVLSQSGQWRYCFLLNFTGKIVFHLLQAYSSVIYDWHNTSRHTHKFYTHPQNKNSP